MYVNVPQLSQFLQQYDPHKPYYLGRWPRMQRGGEASIEASAPVRTQAFYVDDSRFIAQCLILNKFLYSLVIKQHIT